MNIARRSSSGTNRQSIPQPLYQIEPSWRSGDRPFGFFSPTGLPGDGQMIRIGNERGMCGLCFVVMSRKREDKGELNLGAKRV